MGQAVGNLLPLGVAIAIFPVPIIAVVLLVASDRGRAKGLAFIAASARVEPCGMKVTILVGLGALALALVPAATANVASEKALAKRYAPVVRLVEQNGDCGPGKPYLPIDVDALFGEPTVALRGPWSSAGVVKIAPTAKDLSEGLFEYHLDFPG